MSLQQSPPSQDDLWWCGGHFDGDGCVTVSTNGQVDISIGKAEKGWASLDKFVACFGGNVTKEKSPRSPRHQVVARWRMPCTEARNVCRALIPYTLIKSAQLQMALDCPTLGSSKMKPVKSTYPATGETKVYPSAVAAAIATGASATHVCPPKRPTIQDSCRVFMGIHTTHTGLGSLEAQVP